MSNRDFPESLAMSRAVNEDLDDVSWYAEDNLWRNLVTMDSFIEAEGMLPLNFDAPYWGLRTYLAELKL